MRKLIVNICKYSELSDAAKEKARQEFAAAQGFLSADEALASIKALAEHFSGKVIDYEIDWSGGCSHSTMKFDMPYYYEDSYSEIEDRLRKLGTYNPETLKGEGECKLTGVCYDEDAIDGFRKAWHAGNRRMYDLMEAAFRSLLAQCHSEYECFYAWNGDDSEFAEHCEANEYEFYESGRMY